MSSPHILIVGAGVGGLALGQNLKKNGISFTLFERDASPSVRAQGYRVRVAGGGAEGLRECLDDEMFNLFENTCAESKPLTDGGRFSAMNADSMESLFPNEFPGLPKGPGGPGQGPPEMVKMSSQKVFNKPYNVDRTMLRNVLLLGQENHVKFAKSFTYYETTSTGVTAFFRDGTSERGTLLVGADGTFSPVRKQLLPNVRYVDTLSRVIYGKMPLTEELIARFQPKALKWMTVIQDQSLTLFMEPVRFPKDASVVTNGRVPRIDDYAYWVLGGNAETFGLSDAEFHNLSGKDAADLTLKLTSHWDPSFKAIFELQNAAQSAPLRLITAKPERPEWTPSANVVLMSDAIHAMMPTGGSGANTALADASLLGRIIAEKGVSEDSIFCRPDVGICLASDKWQCRRRKEVVGFQGFRRYEGGDYLS
ncbi:FAD-dependent monooxygenase [Lachnellula willkommii]|uniref:FAD-dependent monooxygenase n=1 Tax=Lachnellula willkommii TaxID=215461 RepID=A0A559MBF7_9HELO|nr:FAD-dependent monooxygenase [Lachnellula willkommii]